MDNNDLIKRTKIKLLVMSLSLILPIVVLIVMSVDSFDWVRKQNSVFVKAPYVTYIASGLFLGWIVYKIVKYILIITKEDFANKVCIKKTDERIKYLKLRANALTYKIFIYMMGVATIVCAYVDWGYFLFSIVVFVIFVALHGIVYLVFTKRF